MARRTHIIICKDCGTSVSTGAHNRILCKGCYRKHRNAKQNAKKAAARPLINCAICGTAFTKKYTDRKYCVDCKAEAKRRQDHAYHLQHADKKRQKARDWAIANPGRRREQHSKFKAKHPELVRARERAKYLAKSNEYKERARRWYAANREKVLARMSTADGRAASARRMRERLARDQTFRIYSNFSRAVHGSLKNGKARHKWEGLVGYTCEQLKAHLERQFVKGMSWETWGQGPGKWHIDHIIPRKLFEFQSSDDPEFKACWALSNLRPLWGAENIRKHAKREHLV